MSGANPNLKRDLDKVSVIVYGVYGAMNVPGYSVHQYKAYVPGKTSATWNGLTGGTLYQSIVPFEEGDYTVNGVNVHWSAGEEVGKYRVNVPNGFYVDRAVNVVKVEIDFAGAANTIEVSKGLNMAQNAPNQLNQIISSTKSVTDPAMIGGVTVSRIAGPSVNGERRGGRFIEMGFMQTVNFTSIHGDFNDTAPPFRMVSNVEGKLYLDSSLLIDVPWWQRLYNPPPAPGEQVYLAIASDPVKTDTPFSARDTPRVTIVGKMIENGDGVDFLSLVLDFTTMFGVSTLDPVKLNVTPPTIRASGTWGWDGSDPVDAKSVWTSNVAIPFTTSGKFVEVQDGSVLDPILLHAAIVNSTIANTAVNSQTWTSKLQ